MLKRPIIFVFITAILMTFVCSFAANESALGATNSGPGAKIYSANCSACHRADGSGTPGAFPPLAGNSMVTGAPGKVILAVRDGLNGATTVNGKSYNGTMPAWKGKLTDAEIAQVVTYIRSSWGNTAGAVTEEQVAGAK